MDRLLPQNHQGIIMSITDYQYYSIDEILANSPQFVIILDHLEDPHNFGAIIRTAESAGVDAIIIPNKREVMITPTVMKTSSGALANIKICQVSNLTQAIEKLKKHSFFIYGLDMNGEDYRNIDYSGNVCLVVGNEGKGISRLVKDNCDFIASIPMVGKINSLNASVATGIVIYEVIRNRK